MKAKIKATGEVLIVEEIDNDYVYLKLPGDADSVIYIRKEELELLEDDGVSIFIDWEQRRYEIAKDVMPNFVSSRNFQTFANNVGRKDPARVLINFAIESADELIKALKGGTR